MGQVRVAGTQWDLRRGSTTGSICSRRGSLILACATWLVPLESSCSRGDAQRESPPSPAGQPSAWPDIGPAESVALHRPGDRAQASTYAFSVERVALCPEQPYFPAARGRVRIGMEVSLENTGTDPLLVNPFYAELRDQADYSYRFTLAGCEPTLEAGLLPPGGKRSGWLSFDVRAAAAGLELRYSPLRNDARPGPAVRFAVGDAGNLQRGPGASEPKPL